MNWFAKAWSWMKDKAQYLKTFEPSMLRGVWVAVLGLATSLGIIVTPALTDKVDAFIGVVVAILAILQAYWTRGAVVPVAVHDSAVTQALYTPAPATATPGASQAGDALSGAILAEDSGQSFPPPMPYGVGEPAPQGTVQDDGRDGA